MYTNAQYFIDLNGKQSSIRVDINGVTSFVPIDPAPTDSAHITPPAAAGKLTIAPAE